jgi:tetratricopeptide (TPR) repeat protein
MRFVALCAAVLIACSACDMVDVYQRQIDRASRAIETAGTDTARAAAYSDRGRGRSDKARLSLLRKKIDRAEYVRLFTLAVEDHDRAVALATGDARMYFDRGLTYYDRAALVDGVDSDRTPWFDAARADFTAAVERDGTQATAYDYRGLVNEQTDRIDAAVADYTHVMALDPRLGKSRLADLYCARGQVHAREKNFDLAAVELEKSVELAGHDDGCSCDPYGSLAYVYIDATGQYDKGRDLARRARESGHVIAREYLERLDGPGSGGAH